MIEKWRIRTLIDRLESERKWWFPSRLKAVFSTTIKDLKRIENQLEATND